MFCATRRVKYGTYVPVLDAPHTGATWSGPRVRRRTRIRSTHSGPSVSSYAVRYLRNPAMAQILAAEPNIKAAELRRLETAHGRAAKTTTAHGALAASRRSFLLSRRPPRRLYSSPYGGGHKMCSGRHFTKHEILLSMAIISPRPSPQWEDGSISSSSRPRRRGSILHFSLLISAMSREARQRIILLE